MFRETRFTASFEDRPAYLAAQLASRGRLWRCESPVLAFSCGSGDHANVFEGRETNSHRVWQGRRRRLLLRGLRLEIWRAVGPGGSCVSRRYRERRGLWLELWECWPWRARRLPVCGRELRREERRYRGLGERGMTYKVRPSTSKEDES
jgi:hypothetical protein